MICFGYRCLLWVHDLSFKLIPCGPVGKPRSREGPQNKDSIVEALVGHDMGVSKNSGTSKWMVYNGKPY